VLFEAPESWRQFTVIVVNKWLIQFDIRVDPQQYAERRWDAARRSTYLLRPEVRWPLTVDAMAWPSGLVNCGYTQEDLLALRPTWDLRLNAFGLFDSIEDAVAYRDITDARVPEHAPFWVYALWQLRR
jgi:hypothetical protein